jgi:hypothetical protein
MEASAPSLDPLSVHLRHLPYSTDPYALGDAVAAIVGIRPTDVRLLRDPTGARFSGRAFLSFRTAADAAEALRRLNGVEVLGRIIEARPAFARLPPAARRARGGVGAGA